MEPTSVAERLKTIINHLGLSDSQFADKCDISRATLSLLLSGKNKKISDILLSQIHETFPNVSILWLLFEEGPMTIDQASSLIEKSEDESGNENLKFFNEGLELSEYSNLNRVNKLEETIKNAVIKTFESFLDGNGLVLNKITGDENKRKVRQITVYYDDSTFETFSPER